MRALVALLLLAAVAAASKGDDLVNHLKTFSKEDIAEHSWVVLAAGSTGWGNYRHQADVCHVYQSIHALGVPDEHIVVMMYDDLAQNSRNPTKGILINEPDGPDVYGGVPKDYTGSAVSGDTFIKVLTGVPTGLGSGKIVKSTTQDNVFVYYDDHGGPGIVAFPSGPYYTDKQLLSMVETMSSKKMFKNLVLYIQACYSGSMFYQSTLPPNVYGVSSSPIEASAYAFEYDSKRGTYLASRWAFAFAHLTEVSPDQTLQDQFDGTWGWVKNWSLPCQYGDLQIPKTFTMRSILAGNSKAAASVPAVRRGRINREDDSVPQYDVPFEIARRRFMANTNDNEAYLEFRQEQEYRVKVNSMIKKIVERAAPGTRHLTTVPCDTCDRTCECMQNCDESAAVCKFECCDSQACYVKPKDAANAQCAAAINAEFIERCASKDRHDYLSVAYRYINRLCRHSGVNVQAAIDAIREVC